MKFNDIGIEYDHCSPHQILNLHEIPFANIFLHKFSAICEYCCYHVHYYDDVYVVDNSDRNDSDV